jgi:hypothetical protein
LVSTDYSSFRVPEAGSTAYVPIDRHPQPR